MGFGNFRVFLCFIAMLGIGYCSIQAQSRESTATFLYKQLDYFLQNPTSSGSLRLSKLIHPKKEKLITKEDQLAWVVVHCNLGYYQQQFGNLSSGILYYEKAWSTYYQYQLSDYDIIENCLQPLGNLYLKIGDLPKAENTIKSYLYLAEQSQNQPKIVAAITNLSIAYHNQGKYAKAITVLNQGLSIAPKNLNILNNIATNHLDAGNYNEAKTLAKQILTIDPKQINAYQIQAAIALQEGELQAGQRFMEQARFQLLNNDSATPRSLAKLQLGYIDLLLSASKFKEAQKSIVSLYSLILPQHKDDKQLPQEDHLIMDPILLKILDLHAHLYIQLQNPKQALKAYELAFEVNKKLNSLYPLQDTKIIQHSQNRNRTELYIDLLFELYQSTTDQQYLEKAFQAAEHSKAPLVSEALLSKKVLSQYQNDALVQQKEQITSALASLEVLIVQEKLKQDTANISNIQKWTVAYDAKSLELKTVTQALQNKYPKLLQLQQPISINDLQKKLQQDQTVMIAYFYGQQNIYQFEIGFDSFLVRKIKNTASFQEIIKNYIRYYNDSAAILNQVTDFTKDAAQLFTLLQVPKDVNRLLVIADGLLNFIPFETLLTESSTALSFQNMPFLLHTTEVHYEISAGKYVHSTSKNDADHTVLGVFPVFEDTPLALPYSLTESKYIQDYFEGTYIQKEQATYQNFIQTANNHSIIHLSTHAEAGSFSRPASIKFIDKDILVNQLYGTSLSADLIVLSACETGIGKLAKGEGPISIGRGFQYAGVENVLFSLWRVNDKTTSKLMQFFYKHLHTSHSKSYALYQSKKEYLIAEDISNAEKSPYFWAAFVYYGEIDQPNTFSYYWHVVGFVLLLLIVLLLRKFVQNKT